MSKMSRKWRKQTAENKNGVYYRSLIGAPKEARPFKIAFMAFTKKPEISVRTRKYGRLFLIKSIKTTAESDKQTQPLFK